MKGKSIQSWVSSRARARLGSRERENYKVMALQECHHKIAIKLVNCAIIGRKYFIFCTGRHGEINPNIEKRFLKCKIDANGCRRT
jgi:hypothetical protein